VRATRHMMTSVFYCTEISLPISIEMSSVVQWKSCSRPASLTGVRLRTLSLDWDRNRIRCYYSSTSGPVKGRHALYCKPVIDPPGTEDEM
jgi:hypothetical protein